MNKVQNSKALKAIESKFRKFRYFVIFCSAGLVVGLIMCTFLAAIQQSERLRANDNPAMIAHFIARDWDAAREPAQSLDEPHEIRGEYVTFTTIYDNNLHLIASDGILDGQPVLAPSGVLRAASPKHDNAITWQPVRGLRLATVVVKANNGYIVSAQNLRQTERRLERIILIVLTGYLLSLLLIGVSLAWYVKVRSA